MIYISIYLNKFMIHLFKHDHDLQKLLHLKHVFFMFGGKIIDIIVKMIGVIHVFKIKHT